VILAASYAAGINVYATVLRLAPLSGAAGSLDFERFRRRLAVIETAVWKR
jgi:hypothetical protein